MSGDQTTRGGRRPGAGRKPGQGAGPNPEVRERVPAELAAYCKVQQALLPGFLAGLISDHLKRERMNALDELTELTEEIGLYDHQNQE